MPKRPIIVHFHLFKNAGTSVDVILKNNFSSEWAEIEGPGNKKLDPEDLARFIRENPNLKAISSHTAVISTPAYDDFEIIPIVFIRHPIDRIRSAYDFERVQDAQTPGAIKAKEGDFKHYLDWRLQCPAPWQITNFHASRLKDFHVFTPALQLRENKERSLMALQALPFVGIVEQFDRSMEKFSEIIQESFPSFQCFSTQANTTSDPSASLKENLDKFKKRISKPVYKQLCEINDIDFELYEHVKSRPVFAKSVHS